MQEIRDYNAWATIQFQEFMTAPEGTIILATDAEGDTCIVLEPAGIICSYSSDGQSVLLEDAAALAWLRRALHDGILHIG